MQQVKLFSSVIISACLFFSSCNNAGSGVKKNTDGNAFGDSIPLSNGLIGKIFLLPENTNTLPDFDTMKPLDKNIYVNKIDIPEQNWSLGFPGLPNRFEWFGIEYNCFFKTSNQGNYTFRILSDDGSELFIDNKLIIDNDGMHSAVSKSGDIFLNNSMHEAKILYYQGPRYQLALAAFLECKQFKRANFPGKNFILYTPDKSLNRWWLIAAIILIIAVLIFIALKIRKSKIQNK